MSDSIVAHAKRWLNGPLPADLMADLADIADDENYSPEKRAHQVVWQALKWMMENPLTQNGTKKPSQSKLEAAAEMCTMSARVAELEAKLAKALEPLEWAESQRTDAIRRAAMSVREDPEVLALCNRYGFGAVMDSASRQWVKKDKSGAFFIGGFIGDTSACDAIVEIKGTDQ